MDLSINLNGILRSNTYHSKKIKKNNFESQKVMTNLFLIGYSTRTEGISA